MTLLDIENNYDIFNEILDIFKKLIKHLDFDFKVKFTKSLKPIIEQILLLSEDNDFKLLKAEVAEIKDAQKPAALRKLGIVVDEAKFTASKNKIIRDALRIRLEKDARFRKIVDAVRSQGKILLYYTGTSAASELGGYRGADEKLYGENKIGRFIMELAGGFPV
jgi:predicted NAD-dependent protein-ADP-ribosyltransferase YbiA (DUF1768 family)